MSNSKRKRKNLYKNHYPDSAKIVFSSPIKTNNKPVVTKPKKLCKKVKKEFYNSREWREIRYKALVCNNGKCNLCGRSSKDNIILHVDHIKPISKFPELRLELLNLQVLCEDCNIGKSNKDATDWRSNEFMVKLQQLKDIMC